MTESSNYQDYVIEKYFVNLFIHFVILGRINNGINTIAMINNIHLLRTANIFFRIV